MISQAWEHLQQYKAMVAIAAMAMLAACASHPNSLSKILVESQKTDSPGWSNYSAAISTKHTTEGDHISSVSASHAKGNWHPRNMRNVAYGVSGRTTVTIKASTNDDLDEEQFQDPAFLFIFNRYVEAIDDYNTTVFGGTVPDVNLTLLAAPPEIGFRHVYTDKDTKDELSVEFVAPFADWKDVIRLREYFGLFPHEIDHALRIQSDGPTPLSERVVGKIAITEAAGQLAAACVQFETYDFVDMLRSINFQETPRLRGGALRDEQWRPHLASSKLLSSKNVDDIRKNSAFGGLYFKTIWASLFGARYAITADTPEGDKLRTLCSDGTLSPANFRTFVEQLANDGVDPPPIPPLSDEIIAESADDIIAVHNRLRSSHDIPLYVRPSRRNVTGGS